MAVASAQIDEDQIRIILSKNENQFCDMKSKEIKPSKLSQTLSAFANADGGEVYLGISTNIDGSFRWDGFPNDEAANAHIQLLDELFPIGTVTRCEFLSSGKAAGTVLFVEIEKTTDIRLASNDTPYLRRGAQNLPMDTAEKLERLKLDKGVKTYEDQTLNIDAIDISNSAAVIEFIMEIVPSAEPDAWLKKQRLIVKDKPVVAGVVLFSDEPQVALPKAAVKVYRYKTTDQSGTRDTLAFDPISIDGNAYNQIYLTVNEVKKITEEIPALGKADLDRIEYPIEAIHEIITNAVIHRDYSINDDVHVRIFDNRIEVQSPGPLPGHVTVKNILTERAARNPKIVRLLNKFRNPPNKDVGEGLNTAFEAMRKLKLHDPEIQQLNNSVLVLLKHEKLGTPEQIITDYLKENGEINNSVAREICFIGSENTMKRIFQKMMKTGLIHRIPDRPLNKTAYVKGPNFPNN